MLDQNIFDELIQFVLETISSEDYLKDLNIYRAKQISWNKFKSQVKKQTIKPGIYPRSFGGDSVHFYGVRQNMATIVANGYSSIGGLDKRFAVGLDAQPEHSHGLCQTFALMYYIGEEKRIKKGKYYENVNIGLNFLLEFIDTDYKNRERCWSVKEILNNIVKLSQITTDQERKKIYKSLKDKDDDVCLTTIIRFILSHQKNLKVWFST
jgi:hypothetical protein